MNPQCTCHQQLFFAKKCTHSPHRCVCFLNSGFKNFVNQECLADFHECICESPQGTESCIATGHICICSLLANSKKNSASVQCGSMSHACVCEIDQSACAAVHHACVCGTKKPKYCESSSHQCVCILGSGKHCQSYIHDCICIYSIQKKCHAQEHQCVCNEITKKKCISHEHICVCESLLKPCLSKEHNCICLSGFGARCLSPDQDHKCICQQKLTALTDIYHFTTSSPQFINGVQIGKNCYTAQVNLIKEKCRRNWHNGKNDKSGKKHYCLCYYVATHIQIPLELRKLIIKQCRDRELECLYWIFAKHHPKKVQTYNQDCVICLEPISPEELVVTQCKHQYHKSCVWDENQACVKLQKKECCMCKKKLTSYFYHQIIKFSKPSQIPDQPLDQQPNNIENQNQNNMPIDILTDPNNLPANYTFPNNYYLPTYYFPNNQYPWANQDQDEW